ncbi:MAG: MBL fold metallo-hydrolase [Acidobacteria bacterium]|nr:MBL fold metallo-hydrolase [Acidobacteriota bacterium]
MLFNILTRPAPLVGASSGALSRRSWPTRSAWSLVINSALLLLLWCVTAAAQDKYAPEHNPEPTVPVNPLLQGHSKWFTPKKIYDLKTDHQPLAQFPARLNYDIYSAVGYDLANTILIKGPKVDAKTGQREIIIVDTLGNPGAVKEALDAFRERGILPKGDPSKGVPPPRLPIKAIIYTHNHIDHTAGVLGYLEVASNPPCKPANPEVAGADDYYNIDAQNPDCVAVIGQYKINDGVSTTATVTGTIINARSGYMYGSFIPLNHVNDGIGMQETNNPPYLPGYRMPSRTFNNQMCLTAAGVQMKLIYVPSETEDELSGFVPDQLNQVGQASAPTNCDAYNGTGLLLSAEVIQGPSFPNLYSLRGTSYRNPAQWFRSVDKLRSYDSWCMVPSHGPPICEAKNIQTLLRNFRDAIQFTHDQTIRWMNKGHTMNELAPLVEGIYLNDGEHDRIMNDLSKVIPIKNDVDPKDYLRPFYGSLVQSVRELYMGSVGWFQADPVDLRPTPPTALAKKYVQLMQGGANVNRVAREAFAKGEFEWAAELTTNVIRAYLDSKIPADQQQFEAAKKIKAQAFFKLAEAEMNPNWRNWYISAARELQGLLPPQAIKAGLVSPVTIAALPAGAWVNSLTMRLRAELTAKQKVEKSIGFWFPATGDQGFGALGYVLQIRSGIAEFIEATPAGQKLAEKDVAAADLSISINKVALDVLLREEMKGEKEFHTALEKAYQEGLIKVLNGSLKDFEQAFFAYFEPKPVGYPHLTIR